MGLKNVYGFTDDGKKVKIAEYREVFPVGGIIFSIDDDSTAEVKFYDANKVELQSVAIGDSPAYYDILSEDPRGIDKFFVFNPTRYGQKYWSYHRVVTGAISSVDGEYNKKKVLSATDTSKLNPNIWTWLVDANANGLDGNSDWFIGSKNQVEAVRTLANSMGDSLLDSDGEPVSSWFSSTTEFYESQNPHVWSSTENSNILASRWNRITQSWQSYGKGGQFTTVFAMRSFGGSSNPVTDPNIK